MFCVIECGQWPSVAYRFLQMKLEGNKLPTSYFHQVRTIKWKYSYTILCYVQMRAVVSRINHRIFRMNKDEKKESENFFFQEVLLIALGYLSMPPTRSGVNHKMDVRNFSYSINIHSLADIISFIVVASNLNTKTIIVRWLMRKLNKWRWCNCRQCMHFIRTRRICWFVSGGRHRRSTNAGRTNMARGWQQFQCGYLSAANHIVFFICRVPEHVNCFFSENEIVDSTRMRIWMMPFCGMRFVKRLNLYDYSKMFFYMQFRWFK